MRGAHVILHIIIECSGGVNHNYVYDLLVPEKLQSPDIMELQT